MSQRELLLKELKSQTLGVVTITTSTEESFQNQVLRPILKLQNDLFIVVFENYIKKYKKDFYALSIEKKNLIIENALQKDNKFRDTCKGMIIAFFTIEEYLFYTKNDSNLNKRMINMLIERLKSQIQLFEK